MQEQQREATRLRKPGKTFFTDQFGQKQVLCHECGFRKPRSSYYDTCYKGIACIPAGNGRTQALADGKAPSELECQRQKRRLLDVGGHQSSADLADSLWSSSQMQEKGEGFHTESNEHQAQQSLPPVIPLAGNTPLAPLTFTKQDSFVGQEEQAVTSDVDNEHDKPHQTCT